MPKPTPLEYRPATPPFLRALKANNLALDGRHNVQIPRARGGAGGPNDRLNMRGEEGEDEPVVVDEQGNEISSGEVERLQRGDGDVDGTGEVGNETEAREGKEGDRLETERDRDGEKVTSGFGRKRKAGKVIVEDGEGALKEKHDEDDSGPIKSLEASTKDLKSVVGKGKEDAKKEEGGGKKTKRKKIKLSFDEVE